ncbi:hypothetical protein Taro_042453 [Colocasia esculenta]|uniref:CCHC-type domain-containing protein n=1 Tax=Colocasia esculenta TaxID=4460 RepID=A0A843WSW1_COLES|nr:hypothetical protein [Colocasia esculenta]
MCFECKQSGHLKVECPKIKKKEYKKKYPSKKYKKFKRKSNEEDSFENSSSEEQEEEAINLALMANSDDKVNSDTSFESSSDSEDDLEEAINKLYHEYKENFGVALSERAPLRFLLTLLTEERSVYHRLQWNFESFVAEVTFTFNLKGLEETKA